MNGFGRAGRVCIEALPEGVKLRVDGPLDGIGAAMLEVLVGSLIARQERDLRLVFTDGAPDAGIAATVDRLRRNAELVGARLTVLYGNSSAKAA